MILKKKKRCEVSFRANPCNFAMKSVLVFAGKTEYVTVLKTTVIASGKNMPEVWHLYISYVATPNGWPLRLFFTFVDVL